MKTQPRLQICRPSRSKKCTDIEKERCRAENDEGYFCTRPKGHKGNHIACGCLTHSIRTWEARAALKGAQ